MEVSLSSWPSLLLFLLPLLPILYCLNRRRDGKKYPHDHGLKVYPFVGIVPHLVKNQDRFLEWFTGVMQSSSRHSMQLKVVGLTGVAITADPANVEHILKTKFVNYPKGKLAGSMLEDFLGHGIFASDGERWQFQRKAASYEFSKRSLRNFVVDTVRFEVLERLLPLLERAAAEREDGGGSRVVVDVQDVMERFAFDNICQVAFGEDPGCLAEEGMSAPESAELMAAFSDAQNAIMARFMSPAKWLWRIKRALGMEPEKRMRSAMATVHAYADRIVRERKKGGAELSRRGEEEDLLSRFAAAGEHSDEGLRDVITNFTIAGRDTTSSSLTWFFWLLSTRPDVEERIVREIRAVRAKANGECQGSTTTFGYEEMREMQYLHAAITESMRLYPPVAADTHSCTEEDVLPDGTFVGKGWLMTYCAFTMARLESIWGKDCEEFRPERWLDEEGAFRPENPFKYPVFHAGPRMCIGKEMAYIQMKSIVACVLERFSFHYVGGEGHPKLLLSLTLRMGGGLPMRVNKRSA